jgi:geranylgeranyl diphosphate synthase type II
MDNDDLRRGQPTNHKVFGEAIAVLAGDGLLNEAMSIMFNFCKDKSQNEILACKIISDSAGPEGMIGGQVVDILSEGKKISYETLCYMHKKKTGALIKSSILSGAVLGNASEDDILDVTGDANLIGKNVNSDIDNNKTTFVSTFGLEECKNKCKNLTADCLDILDSINKDTSKLEEITKFLLYREM